MKPLPSRRCVVLALSAMLVALPPSGAAGKLHISDDHRFLAQEDGKPFFYLGDTAWELFHRLTRAGKSLNDPQLLAQAKALASEAVLHLYSEQAGMFRSHPGEDRCDAVDGLGILFLSLLYLETGNEPDLMGFGW